MIKIAVASGKGGTGKTFIATNLFNALINNRVESILVDCDAEAPNSVAFFRTELLSAKEVKQMVPVIDTNACTYCGKCHEYCSYNAIFILPSAKVISVIEDLCHGCGACEVACSYSAITEKQVKLGSVNIYSTVNSDRIIEARMNIGVMSPVPVIKETISECDASSNIAILDSPPGTSCPFIQTVAKADYVILVTEPTPFGLSDLKQSVETLDTIGKKFGVIINRSDIGNGHVKQYLDSRNIQLLMEIPFSREIAKAYTRAELVTENDQFFGRRLIDLLTIIIT
jgi:MinD superfamily P-loop ATPase